MKSAPFVCQSPSQGPIAFSSTHGILVPSSHSLHLMASLRARSILAYQLNSRAAFAFSCSHCIHECPLHSCAIIAFSSARCILVHPLHSRAPIAFWRARYILIRLLRFRAQCILVDPLHSHAPLSFSFTHCIHVCP